MAEIRSFEGLTQPPTFADLGIDPRQIEGLSKMAITSPTDVQRQAIPQILGGRDLLVQSRTGTGKTLAFVLPILERLDPHAPEIRALVVAPTRELADQVGAVFARQGRLKGIRVATITGGVPYGEQLRALGHGVHAVVGTPGRLNDHLSRGTLKLSSCETVVLDEADEILDMGFQEDLEKLLGALPARRQSLLFSATLPESIERMARRYMKDPGRLALSRGMAASVTLNHVVYNVNARSKYEALVNVLHLEQPELALLFCHTKAETEGLSMRLEVEGFKVGYMTGDLPQALRTRTLEAFRHHDIAILVATDVAARGLDVRGISHVINFDIPTDVENYIHRSGRAGRAGREGTVLNFVSPHERRKIQAIAREAGLEFLTRMVPRAGDVQQRLRQRFFEDLVNRIDANDFEDFREFASELVQNLDPTRVVAAMLQDLQGATGKLAAGYEVEEPAERLKKPLAKPLRERLGAGARVRSAHKTEEGMKRLRFNVGRAERINPGYLVRTICDRARVPGRAIGFIAFFPHHSEIDIKEDVAQTVVASLNGTVDDRGRRWSVSVIGPAAR